MCTPGAVELSREPIGKGERESVHCVVWRKMMGTGVAVWHGFSGELPKECTVDGDIKVT